MNGRNSCPINPFSIYLMRSDCANPEYFCVSGARERSIKLSIDLRFKGFNPGLPVLRVSYFHNKGSSKGVGGIDNSTTSMTKSGMWLCGSSGRHRCGVTMYP